MIPVNLIRQYHFCPRIVYFNLLTNIHPVYPRHVSQGEAYHHIQEKLSRHRKFKKLNVDFDKVITGQYIEDDVLGIVGKIDLALLSKTEVIPIEFKQRYTHKPVWGHVLQLYGYGHLLSKYYGRNCERAFVIYEQNIKLHPIKMNDTIKNKFLETLAQIKQIEHSGIFPNSSASVEKCSQCEYLNFCDDRI
jgi:CRISPR-associated exonuclease Cas4